jgi:hypothetical protein
MTGPLELAVFRRNRRMIWIRTIERFENGWTTRDFSVTETSDVDASLPANWLSSPPIA